MHELRDSRTLRVDLLCFFRFHLGFECRRRSGFFDARYRAAPLGLRSGRSTVIPQRASAANSFRRAIDMRSHAVSAVEHGAGPQLLSGGAHETVSFRIVGESRAHKSVLAPKRILRAGFPAVLPGTVEIHVMFRRALNRGVIRVVPVSDDLLRQLPNLLRTAL